MRSFIISVFATLLFVPVAFAQTTQTPAATTIAPQTQTPTPSAGAGQNITLINPLKSGTSLESFLNSILQFVIRIGTIVVILMVVYVGYKFVVAQGAPGKIEEARDMLLWTVIGALVLLGAQAIAVGIQATVRALGG